MLIVQVEWDLKMQLVNPNASLSSLSHVQMPPLLDLNQGCKEVGKVGEFQHHQSQSELC